MSASFEVSKVNGQFPVAALAEFKSYVLQEGEYFVRKIEKGTGKDSQGCVIPALSAEESLLLLESPVIAEAFTQWANGLRGEVCKKRIQEGASVIVADDFKVENIISLLEAAELSEGRISKEKIAAWFDNELAYKLKAALTEKHGAIPNDKMLEILSKNRTMLQTVAKKEHTLSDTVIDSLGKLVSLSENVALREYAAKKLESFKAKEADMFGL